MSRSSWTCAAPSKPGPTAPSCSAEQSAAGQQEVQLLARSLARLPLDQQDIIWLGRFEFPDYQSLATALGCTPATARVRMHRAIKALNSAFEYFNGVPSHV